ncbi:MAG: hypothetical protein P4L53_19775 [Candidatus Obscuribacterales bacterium]|nr:hypothetical protein [Candidatus Obscuribacterales bacterium]
MASNDFVNIAWTVIIEKGHVAHLTRKLRKAELIYRTAVFGAQQAKNKNESHSMELYELLGALYSDRNRAPVAEDYHRKALGVFELLAGMSVVEICIEIRRVAESCRIQGRTEDSINLNRLAESLLSVKRLELERSYKLDPNSSPP